VVVVTPPSGGLTHASGTVPTPAGDFSVAWRRSTRGTALSISVPPNAGARCQFPGTRISELTESGESIESAPGVRVVDTASGTVVLTVGAGRYDFEAAPS
jgi:alpha-L-rhamnosidase